MEVDNFKQIRSLLSFGTPDTFYHLQIIRRGKDHPNLPAANRCIKTYYIDNLTRLDTLAEEIKTLCRVFGARAVINLNPKTYTKCTLMCITEMANRVAMGDIKKIYRTFDTVVGQQKAGKDLARWIVDIDEPFMDRVEEVKDHLFTLWEEMATLKKEDPTLVRQNPSNYIYTEVPTKSGVHLITRAFNLKGFHQKYGESIDIHKNNPTILFIPDNI